MPNSVSLVPLHENFNFKGIPLYCDTSIFAVCHPVFFKLVSPEGPHPPWTKDVTI